MLIFIVQVSVRLSILGFLCSYFHIFSHIGPYHNSVALKKKKNVESHLSETVEALNYSLHHSLIRDS